VLEGSWVVPHLRSRAVWTTGCNATAPADHSKHLRFRLLGRTLRYTVDLSGAGCGCNAALKLVPLLQQAHGASRCPDGYCDAQGSCGAHCAEVGIQAANQYAWSSSLQASGDERGVGIGYPGGNSAAWTESQYAPGGSCIDTAAPFEVEVSFPTGHDGILVAMEVRLSQSGRDCPLSADLTEYRLAGHSRLPEISRLLDSGLTPVISYSGSKSLQWLDGLGKDASGPCVREAPQACADTVRFYGFSVEQIGAATTPEPRLSALAENSVVLAAGGMLRSQGGAPRRRPEHSNHSMGRHHENDTEDHLEDAVAIASRRNVSEWVVVSDESVHVRNQKDSSSTVLGLRSRGMALLGHQEGGWLALDYEPGYIDMSGLKERFVAYVMISEGSCADQGHFPILDVVTCRAAGIQLGYFDATVKIAPKNLPRPQGCYLLDGDLWLSSSDSNVGRGRIGRRLPICSSQAYVTSTSTTTRTSTTTATTTSTWAPSLFCFSLITMTTYEPGIVRNNLVHEAGIFACDAVKLFTHDGVVRVGTYNDGRPLMTTLVLQLPDSMKNRGSFADLTGATCFNTEIFIRVWHTIVANGLYEDQDWTVKVDPDAVFMPHRLARQLIPHTPPGGAPQFLKNCNRFGLGPRMFGAIEVYSRRAIESYKWGEMSCIDFPWKGWGEDYFMEKCLDKLGVAPLNDFSMVADARCTPAPCSDGSKVAFHPFKDLDKYDECWEEADRADRRR